MSYLFIKNLFQRQKFVLFSYKIKNLKKNKKKTLLVSFLGGFFCFFGWVFWVGFFEWVFYCQPCLQLGQDVQGEAVRLAALLVASVQIIAARQRH
jgi:hypothetical protein